MLTVWCNKVTKVVTTNGSCRYWCSSSISDICYFHNCLCYWSRTDFILKTFLR
ncbi:hypothetical protein Syun_023245 [Stephania yunnanensis]|uniref:Uncharacterized protein n=1 Tax=Stephania yunnanensis TaxID=152371 RepID=A0AAP0I3P4_9MAGN